MAEKLLNFMREFVSNDKRSYKIKIGSTVASALAGVVCGAIIASVIWYVAFQYMFEVL